MRYPARTRGFQARKATRVGFGMALALLAGACSTAGAVNGEATHPGMHPGVAAHEQDTRESSPAASAMQSNAPETAGQTLAENHGAEAMQQRHDQPAVGQNQGSYAMQSRADQAQSF